MLDTRITCNGIAVLKEITFGDDSWNLKVRNVAVDLEKQMISTKYHGGARLQAEIIQEIVDNMR